MPCRCDYMEPSVREQESRDVAGHILYIYEMRGNASPPDLEEASKSLYGNSSRVDEWTKYLCNLLKLMREEDLDRIVYNARCAKSRKLADWWEKHQELDAKRQD